MSTQAARVGASRMLGGAGEVFEGDAEVLARAFFHTHERLARDFPHRVLAVPSGLPWPAVPGEDRALLIEMFRQLLIDGRVRAR